MKEDIKKERGEVSRRDFLIGSGAVVVGGAIGAGIAYPLAGGGDGEVTTVTSTKVSTVPTTVTATTTVGGGETVTVTSSVGAGETVTETVTSTTTVSDGGGVEPWQEPEERHYFQVTFH